MEQFVVSARKYRPAIFESVVGQKHITTTLKNSISSNHLPQAFLFCGPRGVGKTTCARILAKTINCLNIGENTEPCNNCESCTSFNNGQSFNIIELDAASNNSVDDIRTLVEQVRFAPQIGKYRVFIIDEVHMLSNQAFNAFLKTLEEPPAHAIFILATTERHKIIPTILSRCQIFDFHRIKLEDIAHHLEFIAKSENVKYDSDALHIIAQKADGGLRDACSMFDQIVSFSNADVSYQAVISNLNILDYDYYFAFTEGFLNKDIAGTLLRYDQIIANGFDGLNFISGLASHFRNLIVARNPATVHLIETGNNIKEKYKEQGAKCTPAFIFYCLNACNETELNFKQSKNTRLLVELALIKMALQGTGKAEEKKNDISEQTPSFEPIKIEEPLDIVQEHKNESVHVVKNITQDSPTNLSVNKPVEKVDTPSVAQAKPTSISAFGLNGSIPKLNTISILSGNKKESEKKTEDGTSEKDLPRIAFSQEDLETQWKIFTDKLLEDKKVFLHSTLTTFKPELKEDFEVIYNVMNSTQKEELNVISMDFLGFLRKELKNYSLKLSFEIVTNENSKERKYYTVTEKFKRMEELNPNITLFKEKLDMEIS
ncbi:MAG: DNA polymerase III subunit gamma/tau [Bacteroidota bacterium]|jgi:DNA polymerase-3 subunit gamma/tau